MENKIKLITGIIITFLLASGGTYYLTDGDDEKLFWGGEITITKGLSAVIPK